MGPYVCHDCHHPLDFPAVGNSVTKTGGWPRFNIKTPGFWVRLAAGNIHLDDSFVVLPKQNQERMHGGYASSAAAYNPRSSMIPFFVPPKPSLEAEFRAQVGCRGSGNAGATSAPRLAGSGEMEESFVVLQQSAPDQSKKLSTTLSHVFDMVSEVSQINHPICAECFHQLKGELDRQARVLELEVKAYNQVIGHLELDGKDKVEEPYSYTRTDYRTEALGAVWKEKFLENDTTHHNSVTQWKLHLIPGNVK